MKKKVTAKSMKVVIILSSFFLCSWAILNGRSDNFLKAEIIDIESAIQFKDSLNAKVSKVDVAWHIDHMLITINEVYKEMEKSNPEDYKSNFSLGRTMMFAFNRIPRGKATSPEIVRPPEIITAQEIQVQLELSKIHLTKFARYRKKPTSGTPI